MISKKEEPSFSKAQGAQQGHHNEQNNFFFFSRHHIGPGVALSLLVAAALLTITVTFVLHGLLGKPAITGKPEPDSTPRPASSSSPPIIVENATELQSLTGDGSVALPTSLQMTAPELATFNDKTISNSAMYSTWYVGHDAAAIHAGVTSITLRGNAAERVHVVGMSVAKDCTRPFSGTYFQGYTQGSGPTAKLAFDLDSPDPIPQQVAAGFVPLGVNFFDQEYVALNPGETMTLAIAAFTGHYACRFRLQMIVATSLGTFSENISDNGKPFIVTAKAPPAHGDRPYSGYRSAYVYTAPAGVPVGWQKINPATYSK